MGRQVLLACIKYNLKDLELLLNSLYSRTCGSIHLFWRSLNYYSGFIKYIAIYVSVLYDMREADFHEISRASNARNSIWIASQFRRWKLTQSGLKCRGPSGIWRKNSMRECSDQIYVTKKDEGATSPFLIILIHFDHLWSWCRQVD